MCEYIRTDAPVISFPEIPFVTEARVAETVGRRGQVFDKDSANQQKHGVSLAFGIDILSDSNRLDILDVRFDYAEERFIAYGMVERRVWLCVFTQRRNRHRIISVRKANDRETRPYRCTPR